eukprot:1639094-Pleurochrysis_carterae.AAC.1
MFQKQGIRTYLNDELRLLVLPSDHHVRIRETFANYTVTLSSDRNFVCAMTNEIDSVERARGQVGQFKILVHARLGNVSIDRINASVNHVRGIEKLLHHAHPNCRACMIRGARKASTKRSTSRQYSYYGEYIARDFCEMPSSSPFGFRYMLCFHDLATKYLEVYYLRNASAVKVKSSFQTFLADNQRYLSGRAVTWLTDDGSEYFEKNLDAFLRELTPLSAYGVFSYAPVASVWQESTSANVFGPGQSIRSWPTTTRWLREALLQLRARHPTR